MDYVANIKGVLQYADRTFDDDAKESWINLTATLKWTDTQGKFKQSYGAASKYFLCSLINAKFGH